MIGNDIVDLALAKKESNWQRNRFLDKIFTENEQLLITNALNPEIMVWNLWTRKEAAYKIYNKQTGIRTFEPRLILCDLAKVASESGRVRIKNEVYFTKTIVTSNYVHSTAALNELDLQRSKIDIYRGNAKNFDYHTLSPKSISHHGDYLALVDFC